MGDTLGEDRLSIARTVSGVVGWCVFVIAIGFFMSVFAELGAEAHHYYLGFIVGPLWALCLGIVALVFGLVVGRLYKGSRLVTRSVLLGVGAFCVDSALLVWFVGRVPVTVDGTPPGPDETTNTPIGWFTPIYWDLVVVAIIWSVVSVGVYILGVFLGRRWSQRRS